MFKAEDKLQGVVIDPSVKKLISRATLPRKDSAARQTETTVSGLRKWAVRLSKITLLICFLTSFFLREDSEDFTDRDKDKGGHIWNPLVMIL